MNRYFVATGIPDTRTPPEEFPMTFTLALATATPTPAPPAETSTALLTTAVWGALLLLALVVVGVVWAMKRR